MSVHIGEKIKQRAKELRIGPTELGNLIFTSKQNIIAIYKRKTIDAELLSNISRVLAFDFFQYYAQPDIYSEKLNSAILEIRKDADNCKAELENSRRELEQIKKENEYLKEINSLLKRKID